MAKVVYCISRRNRDNKMTGVADLSDGTLCVRANKGREIVFEDIFKYCHPIINKPNQYKGYITLAYEDVPVYDKCKNNYKIIDYMEVGYYVWFKYVA